MVTLLLHLAVCACCVTLNKQNSLVTRGHSLQLFLDQQQNTCMCQTSQVLLNGIKEHT